MQTTAKGKIPHGTVYVNPPSPDSMIHHNVTISNTIDRQRSPHFRIILKRGYRINHYGVSSSQRVLSPQLLYKRFDEVRDCLFRCIGLTTAEREVVLRLLRYWSYYGEVYPKAASICIDPGCSKATFWRTIIKLRKLGLINVVNRYIIHPHAQISNLYLLHGLIVVIARYLAEHGQQFTARWIRPFLLMPGAQFWSLGSELESSIFAHSPGAYT